MNLPPARRHRLLLATDADHLRPAKRVAIVVFMAVTLLAAKEPMATPAPCARPATEAGPAAGKELRVQFMGTTTLLFDDGDTQILIDGYFSRPPLIPAAIGLVSPNVPRIKQAMARAGIGQRLKAIFVAHAHVDHVLDAPWIAQQTPADLIGSPSVEQVAISHEVAPTKRKVFCGTAPYHYGAFSVTPIETPHSRPNIARGEIKSPVGRVAWAQRYRARKSHAFLIEHGPRRLLVYPSTAYVPGLLKNVRADVVFLSMAGLGRKGEHYANAYWAEVVEAVRATRVYPVHWDNFGRPLNSGLRPMPWPFDAIPRGQKHLRRLAEAHCVDLQYLRPFDQVDPYKSIEHQLPETGDAPFGPACRDTDAAPTTLQR
jgi:L-ascorbate metabolism protein UlaG (beta-lactamase superfamily)